MRRAGDIIARVKSTDLGPRARFSLVITHDRSNALNLRVITSTPLHYSAQPTGEPNYHAGV